MKWFAIFKTGKHTDSAGNTREWTEADLDVIVAKYDPQKHEAPIVIGHPASNAPAFGWIEKLKRVGDTLYAYPKQLAQEFVEMVNKGLFKKRSISLYPDGTLRHVGFLGAQPPAVKGLPDVQFAEGEPQTLESDLTTDLEEPPQPNEQKSQQPSTPPTPPSQQFQEVEQLKAEKAVLEQQLQELQKQIKVKAFEEFLDEQVRQGNLLPRQVPLALKLYEVISQTELFEFSDHTKVNPIECFKEYIKAQPSARLMDEQGKKSEQTPQGSPLQIVTEEIRKHMSQH